MKNTSRKKADRNGRCRRRGTARLFVLGAAFMASTSASSAIVEPVASVRNPVEMRAARARTTHSSTDGAGAVASGDQTRRQYDIPAGPLSEALTTFERASGVKVTLAIE